MPRILFLLLFFFFTAGYLTAQTLVDDCPGKPHKIRLRRDHAIHRKRGERIDNDGFRRENRKMKKYGERAEKGRKAKSADESRVKRFFRLRRQQRATTEALDRENKKLFHGNEKKRKKEISKKARNPEMGLFPKGMR